MPIQYLLIICVKLRNDVTVDSKCTELGNFWIVRLRIPFPEVSLTYPNNVPRAKVTVLLQLLFGKSTSSVAAKRVQHKCDIPHKRESRFAEVLVNFLILLAGHENADC